MRICDDCGKRQKGFKNLKDWKLLHTLESPHKTQYADLCPECFEDYKKRLEDEAYCNDYEKVPMFI